MHQHRVIKKEEEGSGVLRCLNPEAVVLTEGLSHAGAKDKDVVAATCIFLQVWHS